MKMSINGGRSFDYQGIITIGKIRLWKVVVKPGLLHCMKDYFAKALSLFVDPGVACEKVSSKNSIQEARFLSGICRTKLSHLCKKR